MAKGFWGGARYELTPEIDREIQDIEAANNGKLHAELLIDAAQNPQSSFHDKFEWDDTVAGHEWRKVQARHLITAFRIIHPETKVEIQAFTSLEVDRVSGGGYRRTEQVLQSKDLRVEMVWTALHQLMQLEAKYHYIQELARIWGAVEQTKEELRPTFEKAGKTLEPKAADGNRIAQTA